MTAPSSLRRPEPRHRPRDVVLLGATGSIGTQAEDVVLRNPERFRVTALAAGGGRPDLLAQQAVRLGVHTVAVAEETSAAAVKAALDGAGADGVRILAGPGPPSRSPLSRATSSSTG